MARMLKLPRQYYRRRSPPPALRSNQERFIINLSANLNSIGPGRNRAINDIRKVLLQDVASAIVRQTREVHINVTMGNQPDISVKGFRQLYAAGSFQGPTAVIVDGSPTRPIKNVRFAGDITFMAQADTSLIAEAATFAWGWILRYSASYRGPYSGDQRKKGKSRFRYHTSFEMFINNSTPISGPDKLRKGDALTTTDWVTISNYVPYAARLERYRYPKGAFYMAWKKTRAKYGKRLAIRMDYVQSAGSGATTVATSGGPVPNAQPVLRIGQPGAFPSRVPPMRKNIKNANRRGRG